MTLEQGRSDSKVLKLFEWFFVYDQPGEIDQSDDGIWKRTVELLTKYENDELSNFLKCTVFYFPKSGLLERARRENRY